MDLTTAGLVTGAVGFIVGSLFTTLIFVIVTGAKKNKLKKESIKRHEIIGSIGKKCAEIDHAYSEFRIGKIPFESLGAMILEKIEDVNTELNSNSDILDSYYIKNIERFLEDQKNYLMNGVSASDRQERSSVRPVVAPIQEDAVPEIDTSAAVNAIDEDHGIHEISAEEPNIEEFSVEPADEADEFHIEEEPIIEQPPMATQPKVEESVSDSAFGNSASQVDMGGDQNFDFNATTVLSVDELHGSIKEEKGFLKQPEAVQPEQSASLHGQSLLTPEVQQEQTFAEPPRAEEQQPVNVAPTPAPVAPQQPQAPVHQAPSAQQEQPQPFVDMDATQVFDQGMFQAAIQNQQQTMPQPQQNQVPPQPKSPLQFEQPIPEPPVSASNNIERPLPQQPAFPGQGNLQQPQQSLSAFDVEATQEFHVSDIMQHAEQPKESEEIFEINMPGSAPAQTAAPKKTESKAKDNDMVSGDDVANQMDNFFGFD